MNKTELKDLVKRYFNLVENNSDNLEKEVFADAELIDGTKITNMKDSEFSEGDEVHVITESGEHVIAPSGEHELKSGIVITIDGEGKITGIKRPGAEGEGSLEAADSPVAEEMAAESSASVEKTEMAEHDEEDMEEEIIEEVMQEDEIKEAVVEAIAEVIAPEIEAMKKKMADIEEAMKDYMSKPADVPTSEKKFSKKAKANKPEVLNKKRYEMALNRINNK